MMSSVTMSLETNTEVEHRTKLLESLAEKFQAASRSNGIWIGAEESEYISQIFSGYAELVNKLNGVWKKDAQS